MTANLVAKATITVDAPVDDVWKALTDPQAIAQYMFGADVHSDWSVGSPITWDGEFKGQPFHDKGVIQAFEPNEELAYSHFSSTSGKPDEPENYHNVRVHLTGENGSTHVTLTQDNNHDETARKHSKQNWEMMLEGLKKVSEGSAGN